MYVTFHGNTCIRLQEKTQSRDLTVVVDPYTPKGVTVPGIGAGNVVMATRGDKDLKGVSGDPFEITGPGEYEIKGVMIHGTPFGDATVYRFDVGNVRFVHVGLFKGNVPDGLIESFGDVDVLFVPVGGEDTLKPHQAVNLVQTIQPRVVIPMAYKVKGLDNTHGTLDAFLKEIGAQDAQKTDKFKAVRKNLPDDEMAVVILKTPQ